MIDVLVVGHVVKDRFPDHGDRQMPGGTAYYSSLALRSLGARVRILTRLAADDRDLLLAELLTAGAEIEALPSRATTEFVHRFPHGPEGERVLSVGGVAPPFAPEDLDRPAAEVGYAGPLTAADLPLAALRALRARCRRLAIDLQGLVRHVREGGIELAASPEAAECLRLADIVKADLGEASVVTGEVEPHAAARALAAYGPAEVIVTMSDRGSVLVAGGQTVQIPALPPARFVDPTGCGDTFLAAYVFARERGDEVLPAARFAAAAAACKLQQRGALRSTAAEVESLMRRHPA